MALHPLLRVSTIAAASIWLFPHCSAADPDAATATTEVPAAAATSAGPSAAPPQPATSVGFLAPTSQTTMVPSSSSTTTKATTTVDPDVIVALAIQASLAELSVTSATGHLCLQGRRGAWLYGDHAQKDGVPSVVACADLCVADDKCSHWNYQPLGLRCDLKTGGTGGFNEDANAWVSGDCSRHLPTTTTVPADL